MNHHRSIRHAPERNLSITAFAPLLQRKREERPPLLPLPGPPAASSRYNVAERTHNTAELATGSVGVLLLRMLLPPARRHSPECCLPAAAARAGRRNRWHRCGLVADQWRHSTIPAGKPRLHTLPIKQWVCHAPAHQTASPSRRHHHSPMHTLHSSFTAAFPLNCSIPLSFLYLRVPRLSCFRAAR